MCAGDTGRTVTEHRAGARHNDRRSDHTTGHHISNANRHQTQATPTAAPPTTTRAVPTSTRRTPATHSRAACLRDENECYEPGTDHRCETGSCVDAARGVDQRDKDDATQKWLREHPGYCAVGTQGAVAPCDE